MEQKNELAAQRFNIEKSESLNNIGYFQAEYDTERGDEPYDHFGYQIGIRIPIVNPDKPQLNRRKLALMDDEAFWIQMKGRFIHIRYFAIRDNLGNYKGTLEVSQDVTEIKELKGEKRLLD